MSIKPGVRRVDGAYDSPKRPLDVSHATLGGGSEAPRSLSDA